jgi:hypothetical protein
VYGVGFSLVVCTCVFCLRSVRKRKRSVESVIRWRRLGVGSDNNEFALGEEATSTSTPTCLIVFHQHHSSGHAVKNLFN